MYDIAMRKYLAQFATVLIITFAWCQSAHAQDKAVELWRLDCGRIEVGDVDYFSDSFAYPGISKTLTDSCYLIRNGEQYLLWDTGMPREFKTKPLQEGGDTSSLDTLLVDQLEVIDVKPSEITFIGVSHYHYDHTGQAEDFEAATLLIDKKDWEVVKSREDLSIRFASWVSGNRKSELLTWDKDVFGDGSVIILRTPGHTPGHRSLLVNLKDHGPVLLSGDAAHFRENWSDRVVPSFNTSRSESLASMERLQDISNRLGATLIIQHDLGDIGKLASFPASSK